MSRHESSTIRIRDLFYGSVIAISVACTASLISLSGITGQAASAMMATPFTIQPATTLPEASTTSATAGSAASIASTASTPVATHGALSVQGSGLVDRDEAAALASHGSINSTDRILSGEDFNDSGTWDRACLRDSLGLV